MPFEPFKHVMPFEPTNNMLQIIWVDKHSFSSLFINPNDLQLAVCRNHIAGIAASMINVPIAYFSVSFMFLCAMNNYTTVLDQSF